MTWASSHSYPSPAPLSIEGLSESIRNSAIKAAYGSSTVSGSVLTIGFKANLDAADVSVLDGIVAAHDGVDPTPAPKTVISRSEIHATTGLPAVTVLAAMPGSSFVSRGYQIIAPPSTLQILDIRLEKYLIGPAGICNFSGGKYICRSPATVGSALHFAFVDRDGVLEVPGMPGVSVFDAYGLSLSILPGVTGAFVDGEEVVGQTSSAETYVIRSQPDGLAVVTFVHTSSGEPSVFLAGESIIGQTSGVSAVLGTVPFVEGDVYEIQRPIQHEWVEGLQEQPINPDGARPVPKGLYARFLLSNADTVNPLRVDTYINFSTE